MKLKIKITVEKIVAGIVLLAIEIMCIFMLYSSLVSSSVFYDSIRHSKILPFPYWIMQILFIVVGVTCFKFLQFVFRSRKKELLDFILESKREINIHIRDMKVLDENIEKYKKELETLK